ncbi:MAG: hypothetical protein RL651_786 [Pseudomonadota bacterium]|jgi:choloylglycine hydrolase
MKTRSLVAAIASGFMTLSPISQACTAVDVQAKDGSVIAGRTMEWFYDMQWQVASLPIGTDYQMTAPPKLGLPAVPQKTKYGIVGVSTAIIDGTMLLEGQNTGGLGMSGNFLPGFTEYQTVTASDKNYVSILDFGTWALGSFATISDLKAALPNIKVWYDPSLKTGPTPPTVHFVFNDRSGKGIVVEFVEGQMQIHENKVHVLTNAPTYQWQLTNLRNYINISTKVDTSVKIGGLDLTALGSGGNTMALRADYSPPSRFARTAFLRWNSPQPANASEALQLTGHILNNVDIPKGVAGDVVGNETVWDTTQWVAFKDLTNNQFYIADYEHRTNFVRIDINQLADGKTVTKKLINALPYPAMPDLTSVLK